MRLPILVSENPEPDVTMTSGALSNTWAVVGTLDMARESAARKVIQGALGLRTASRRGFSFWADCDSDGPWVASVLKHAPPAVRGHGLGVLSDYGFWLALDLRRYHSRYLLSCAPVKLQPSSLRPPEPHPGSLVRTTPLPIRLTPRNGQVLRTVQV